MRGLVLAGIAAGCAPPGDDASDDAETDAPDDSDGGRGTDDPSGFAGVRPLYSFLQSSHSMGLLGERQAHVVDGLFDRWLFDVADDGLSGTYGGDTQLAFGMGTSAAYFFDFPAAPGPVEVRWPGGEGAEEGVMITVPDATGTRLASLAWVEVDGRATTVSGEVGVLDLAGRPGSAPCSWLRASAGATWSGDGALDDPGASWWDAAFPLHELPVACTGERGLEAELAELPSVPGYETWSVELDGGRIVRIADASRGAYVFTWADGHLARAVYAPADDGDGDAHEVTLTWTDGHLASWTSDQTDAEPTHTTRTVRTAAYTWDADGRRSAFTTTMASTETYTDPPSPTSTVSASNTADVERAPDGTLRSLTIVREETSDDETRTSHYAYRWSIPEDGVWRVEAVDDEGGIESWFETRAAPEPLRPPAP